MRCHWWPAKSRGLRAAFLAKQYAIIGVVPKAHYAALLISGKRDASEINAEMRRSSRRDRLT